MRHARQQGSGIGVLGVLSAVTLAVLVFGLLLDGDQVAAALGWVLLCGAGLLTWSGSAVRRRRERQHLARLRRRRARENRRDARLVRLTGYAMRPVDEHTVLPPVWAEPVASAFAAAADFRRAVAQLPAGPVRDRLAGAVHTIEQGAWRCDATARRGAELERQLRLLTHRTGFGVPGLLPAPLGRSTADQAQLRAHVAELSASVERAREAVNTRCQQLRLSSARVAQAALSASLTGGDQLDGATEVLADVAALARGLEEIDDLATQPLGTPRLRAAQRPA